MGIEISSGFSLSAHYRPFGAWDWPIPFSAPETAQLELLAGVRHEADFATADKFFASTVNLRPGLLRDLLRACTQVKAKRLFLWFSDRHGHAWCQALDTEGIDLGRGKRLLVKGGAYRLPNNGSQGAAQGRVATSIERPDF